MADLVECRSLVESLSRCDSLAYSAFILFMFRLTRNYTPDVLSTSRIQKEGISGRSMDIYHYYRNNFFSLLR
jgi:hypothetical protein